MLQPRRLAILLVLILSLAGHAAWAAYIDPNASPRLTSAIPSDATQMVALANDRVAILRTPSKTTPAVRVVDASGTQIYETALASALGTRINNYSSLALYPIAGGALIVTVEGTNTGCDNNTSNMFAFLRLDASGNVATPLTSISTTTASYNCYTNMAELSNGNLAFTYQYAGDEYLLRIMQPNGTAVTSPSSVQKTGTGNGTCASQSAYSGSLAANGNGTFLVTHHCYQNSTLYGTLYSNAGTQITVGAAQHFSIGSHGGSPGQWVLGLGNDNFMVAWNDGSTYQMRSVSPTGTVTSMGTYSAAYNPWFLPLGDGGFVVADDFVNAEGGGYENYHRVGTVYSDGGSVVQAATRFDNDYYDRCDVPNYASCEAGGSALSYGLVVAGYDRGIVFPNPRTGNITLHSFTTANYSIGGTVSGLSGSGLVLQNNAGDDLSIAANGSFTFATSIASGSGYAVTVKTQPSSPSQTCSVTNGSGTLGSANVTDVSVSCTTNTYTIGGTVTGLDGTGLVLQNNAGGDLSIAANGSFTFAAPIASGSGYAVTVKTQPSLPSQTCSVTNGSGTVGSTNVTSVSVNCTTDTYTIGGTVSGLAGAGLVLQNNAGDDLAVGANGSFTFATPIASGSGYAVTVKTQPSSPTQTCNVTNGISLVGGSNVTSVSVSCTTNSYTIGGTVSGLSGTGLILQNNAGNDLAVGANGSFTFSTPIASGSGYAVTVKTQPSSPSQTCSVTSGTGTVGSSNVTSVSVSCTTDTFMVGGTVSGLAGSGLVLQNNAGDDLAIAANGSFTFATPVASGSGYAVTVATQPSSPSQTCSVTSGTGTVGSSNVTSVSVSCTTDTFVVGGTVSGLAGTGLILQNNGGDDLAIAANGSFTFATPVVSGSGYAVTVATQPSSPSQTCSVTSGTGTVGSSNVTSVSVSCTTDTYTIGGTVSGLAGSGLVLQNNAGDDLAIAADGSFTFAAPVASGSVYAVTIRTQPSSPSQTCSVTSGTGTVGSANVASVSVGCTTDTYTIGGTVSGLAGTGLVLQNNAGDDLAIAANGSFTFATSLVDGSTYSVSVAGQPSAPNQTCSVVSNGNGTLAGAAVTGVSVTCTTETYAIGGVLSGLAGGGLVLQLNGGNDLMPGSDGAFAFPTALVDGSSYTVTVVTQPSAPNQTCSISNGSGTLSGADVTHVQVTCSTDSYAIGGTVSGLAGTGLVLRNNGGDDLAVAADGSFTFTTPVADGGSYLVTVAAQPGAPSQTCTVGNAGGNVAGTAVLDVTVACTTDSFSIGGTVSGLAGSGLVLQLNGGSDLAVGADGSFAFPAALIDGSGYAVSVLAQPGSPNQTCTVANGTGTLGGSDVVDVSISCTTSRYAIGGTIGGLAGTGLVLQLNGADDLAIGADGSFAFPTSLDDGSTWTVSVLSQPSSPNQTCVIGNGSGTLAGAAVGSVMVNCTTTVYAVGGDVSGLAGSGLVLRLNGGDDLAISANGSFAFASPLPDGSGYAVTVATQPSSPNQTCSVANGNGTLAGAPISAIQVTCASESYRVGGGTSGLAGSGLVLRNNGGDDLAISSNGPFVFPTALADGSSYAVSVATQPESPRQSCTVTAGDGTLAGADVTSVAVGCVTITHVVTASAGANGAIMPAAAQTVDDGSTLTFAVTADDGYSASVSGTCGGILVGNVYTTAPITADCSVVASFIADDAATFTVTPSAGPNGSILPATPQTVADGATTSFTINADSGYHASVSGTCGGILVGNVYTTAPITADCSVVASFIADDAATFTVTPSAGPNGSILPATPQTVADGATTSFTVNADSGYTASVGGSCGGTLAGDVFTTGPVTADCDVLATFEALAQAPGAPTAVRVQLLGAQATVQWAPPADDGGAPITSYTVTAQPGGQQCMVSGNPPPNSCTITGLNPSGAYTFTVVADNGAAQGAPGVVSIGAHGSGARAIPAMSEWMLLLSGLLLTMIGGGALRRRA